MYDTSKQNIDPHTARIDYIAGLVTDMLEESVPAGEKIWAASHLFGVADHAALLAGMRGPKGMPKKVLPLPDRCLIRADSSPQKRLRRSAGQFIITATKPTGICPRMKS